MDKHASSISDRRKAVAEKYEVIEQDGQIGYSIALPAGPLRDMLERDQIQTYWLTIIHKVVWSDTGEDCHTSVRLKYLDAHSAKVYIIDHEPLSLYWSKR